MDVEQEVPQLQRLVVAGIATSTEGGKKMIYAGTMLQIVKKLLIWLVTEPDRKGISRKKKNARTFILISDRGPDSYFL
jgi:hypothetical protein